MCQVVAISSLGIEEEVEIEVGLKSRRKWAESSDQAQTSLNGKGFVIPPVALPRAMAPILIDLLVSWRLAKRARVALGKVL